MSKCQKNKYFNVGSCVVKESNPAFQQSLAKMMSDRQAQDSKFNNQIQPKKDSKQEDIDLILKK
jgi:hypothetical protein